MDKDRVYDSTRPERNNGLTNPSPMTTAAQGYASSGRIGAVSKPPLTAKNHLTSKPTRKIISKTPKVALSMADSPEPSGNMTLGLRLLIMAMAFGVGFLAWSLVKRESTSILGGATDISSQSRTGTEH